MTDKLDAFPEVLRKWLLLMKRTEFEDTVKDSIDGTVETEDFKQSFHNARENVSSSPSGLHYTIWKSIATNDELSAIMAKMMGMPFRFGIKNL